MWKNWLKGLFDWIREVLEAADVPFVLLVLVVLPFVVPFVPAWVTAMNLREIMGFPPEISFVGGLTIELLGFSGAILFLRSIMDWKRNEAETFSIWLTGLSYAFYLVAVIVINVILDMKAGKDWSYIWVIACLCLLSVPSGLLSASRINQREADNKAEKAHQEKRSDRMSRWMMKHGFSIGGASGKGEGSARVFNSTSRRTGYASDHKKKIVSLLDAEYRKSKKVLGPSELCRKVKIDLKQRGAVYNIIQEWKHEHGL